MMNDSQMDLERCHHQRAWGRLVLVSIKAPPWRSHGFVSRGQGGDYSRGKKIPNLLIRWLVDASRIVAIFVQGLVESRQHVLAGLAWTQSNHELGRRGGKILPTQAVRGLATLVVLRVNMASDGACGNVRANAGKQWSWRKKYRSQ